MNSIQTYASAFQPALGPDSSSTGNNLDVQKSSQALSGLTIEEMRVLDFEPPYDCTYFSWSPQKAFDARENAEVGTGDGWETLHTYLTDADGRSIAADCLLEVNPRHLPTPQALITIYRVTDSTSGSDWDAILPGASVSESRSHAKRFADIHLDKKHKAFSTKVYPDELVTHGNPHDFIYVPRSLQVGFERYQADMKRWRDARVAGGGRGWPGLGQ